MEDLSESPTQSNEGRSYDQYNTQSSHDAGSYDHGTLHDDDTGAVRFDFNKTQHSLDASAPDNSDELPTVSRIGSQEQPTSGSRSMPPPETPAVLPKPFHWATNDEVIRPSQLIGQTQYTSAAKKASPTSSRPSPNIFNHNTLSPNPMISSPLKDRGLRTSPTHDYVSSPAFPGHSSGPSDAKAPSPRQSQENGANQFNNHVSRRAPEPLSEYRPIRDNDTDPSALGDLSEQEEEQDYDLYDTVEAEARRSRIAQLKRTKADMSLTPTSLLRCANNSGNVEVPSTGRPKSRSNRNQLLVEEQYIAQCNGKIETEEESQETVADSQDRPAPLTRSEPVDATRDDSTGEVQEDDVPESSVLAHKDPLEVTVDGMLGLSDPQTRPSTARGSKEMIPETSPPGPSVQPPRLIGDILNNGSSATSDSAMISIPELPSSDPGSVQLGKQQDGGGRGNQLPPFPPSRSQPIGRSSPSVVPASTPRNISRRSTGLRKAATQTTTLLPSTEPSSEASSRTSTLTTLSVTPNVSSSITPNTEKVGRHGVEEAFPSSGPVSSTLPPSGRESSPAEAKVQRRGRPPLPKKTYSSVSIPSNSFRSRTRQSSRHSSLSTDELAKSPSSSLPASTRRRDHSKISNARRSLNTSTTNSRFSRKSSLRHGIFDGMAFAISFRGRQTKESVDQYNERLSKGKSIERMIREEGGRILESGFNELFQFDSLSMAATPSIPVMSSSLQLISQDTGFTALIADGHSRKAKYMQALALGLPCLAPKWITSCIAKGDVVDWSSYLLCAGQSTLLGDAIRSRDLRAYDASTAMLVEVMDQRPKLLEGTQILLVMKKTKNEDKRQPYVFLAQVLGGSLIRANTPEEARAMLLEREGHGEPFDWVYVDDQMPNIEEALFGPKTAGVTSRKRKRQSVGNGEGDHPPKRIRTLNDELVIQSLILGRLIEDEEMDDT